MPTYKKKEEALIHLWDYSFQLHTVLFTTSASLQISFAFENTRSLNGNEMCASYPTMAWMGFKHLNTAMGFCLR